MLHASATRSVVSRVAGGVAGWALLAAATGALLLAGCSEETAEPTGSPAVSAPTTEPDTAQSPGEAAAPSGGAAPGTAEEGGEESGALEPDVGVQEVEVSVADGAVTPPPGRVEVALGDRVRLTVLSDQPDEVHVHGYELEGPVGPGQPFVVEFVADADGQYEVETHDSGLLLFQLLVR